MQQIKIYGKRAIALLLGVIMLIVTVPFAALAYISWCAEQSGLTAQGLIPKFSYCPTGIRWFQDAGRWQERTYEPQPGDITKNR